MSNKESTASGHRKLALKRADGEPLSRQDLQYEFLCYVFEDQHAVFTDPYKSATDGQSNKLTFRDLYVNALINSPRSSKVLRDKMTETPEFGTDFAKISLLANVGRINTTMAFFPEMRTTLRTYHPVPALQKTEGNLQDAPRIKNTLKACLLPSEVKGAPSTPSDVLVRAHSNAAPSTSVVNLIFIMANHSGAVGRSHFEAGLEFVDLFLPVDVPSRARAQAFLWLCYHYLESPTGPNPFDDDFSREHPSKAPSLPRMPAADISKENIDPPEELEWGKRKTEERKAFLKKDKAEQAKTNQQQQDDDATAGPTEKPAKKPRVTKEKLLTDPMRKAPLDNGRHALQHKGSHQRLLHDNSLQSSVGEPYHLMPLRPATDNKTKAPRGRRKAARDLGPPLRYATGYPPPQPERTMFEHAWHVVSTTNPLAESDEENADDHVRLDYSRRLKTLIRLRGKSPTPEPTPTMDMDNHGW